MLSIHAKPKALREIMWILYRQFVKGVRTLDKLCQSLYLNI